MRNQKRRRADGAAAPQDGKAPAKTRRAKRPSVGDRFGGTHTPDGGNRRVGRGFPRAAPIGRVALDRENGRFPPLAACQRRRILQTPAQARFRPPSAKSGAQRNKARAGRLGGRKRVSQTRMRGKVRAGGPPDGPGAGNLRRCLRLAGGPLVLQQLQRTFFVLVFLYFDYACTQSPAHRAAEKTGRTIFS